VNPWQAAETGKQIAFREVLSFSNGGFAEKWQGLLVADDLTRETIPNNQCTNRIDDAKQD